MFSEEQIKAIESLSKAGIVFYGMDNDLERIRKRCDKEYKEKFGRIRKSPAEPLQYAEDNYNEHKRIKTSGSYLDSGGV